MANTPSQTHRKLVTQCAVQLKEFTFNELSTACCLIDKYVNYGNLIDCLSEAILNEVVFETDKEADDRTTMRGVILDSEGRSYKCNRIFTTNRPGTFRSLDANWNI